MGKQFGSIPGLEELNNSNDEENGLITSDSDFEQAELAAGYGNPQDKGIDSTKKQTNNLKRDVSKTFKKMLTSNNKRLNISADKLDQNGSQFGESTKYNGS